MDVVSKLIVIVLVSLLYVLGGSGPATGHTALVSSDPADGSTVDAVPQSVVLEFTEELSQSDIAATAPDGSTVQTSDARIAGSRMTAELAPSDQRGRYRVAYRVVAGDGHPVSGTITFTTTSGAEVVQAPAEATSDPFVDRNEGRLVLGLAAAAVVVGLIVALLRRRRRG